MLEQLLQLKGLVFGPSPVVSTSSSARASPATKGKVSKNAHPYKRRAKPTSKQFVHPLDLATASSTTTPQIAASLPRPIPSTQPSEDVAFSSPAKAIYYEPDWDALVDDMVNPPSNPSKTRSARAPGLISTERLTLYDKWNRLLPALSESLISSFAAVPSAFTTIHNDSDDCAGQHCTVAARNHFVTCVSTHGFQKHFVHSCHHRPLPLALLDAGFFPSGPSTPGYGFCIKMLNLYLEIIRSPVASVQGLSGALSRHHRFLDTPLLTRLGAPIQEAYRRPLQHALQWFDVALARVANVAALTVQALRPQSAMPVCSSSSLLPPLSTLPRTPRTPRTPHTPHTPRTPRTPHTPHIPQAQHSPRATSVLGSESLETAWSIWATVAAELGRPLTGRSSVDDLLLARCPACMGFKLSDIGFKHGGNVHAATDGNFNQAHRKSAGTSPPIDYELGFFVPKVVVDAVGHAHDFARKKGPTRAYNGAAPEDAIQSCEDSHTSSDNTRKKKSLGDQHDDTGLMALVCRHDIPLFVCNIDTPGEPQKYALALFIWLLLHLPDDATVGGLYDVGCVTSRIISLYDILPPCMEGRIVFAITAMHAFAHHWACQLVFNPRFRPGYGLSDGEGVERLWSGMTDLIGILLHVSRPRRLVMIDRTLASISDRMRDDLGRWLARKLKSVVEKRREARGMVAASGLTEAALQEQWEAQRAAQLSVGYNRMTDPAVRRQLKTVMELQDNVAQIELDIASAEAILQGHQAELTREHLRQLRETQAELYDRAESLYATLKVDDIFPEVVTYGQEFGRLLVMAFDAKCVVRHRLIGRFFEWDRLDQAVGGVHIRLGTKESQYVLKAMSRRTPALKKSIAHYNELCARLQDRLDQLGLDFPLPQPIDTELTRLKDNDTGLSHAILEDVWLAGPADEQPWLIDPKVRAGIRGKLLLDRCDEEEWRLVHEAGNLQAWIVLEWTAVQTVSNDPDLAVLLPWFNALSSRLRLMAAGMASCRALLDRAEIAAAGDHPLAPIPFHPGDFDAAEEEPDLDVETLLRVEDQSEYGDQELDDPDDVAFVRQPFPVDALAEDDGGHDGNEIPLMMRPIQLPLRVDTTLLSELHATLPDRPLPPAADRQLDGKPGIVRVYLESQSFQGLLTSRCVNEEIVYGGLVTLRLAYERQNHPSAIFPTWVWTKWKHGGIGEVDSAYRIAAKTQFWAAEVVLIPMHMEATKHWIGAAIYPARRRIVIYDSFADSTVCDINGQSLARLFIALLRKAKDDGHVVGDGEPQRWRLVHALTDPVQSNGYDCGIWVVAMLGATLRGKGLSGLREANIPAFRKLLYRAMCTMIPVHNKAA